MAEITIITVVRNNLEGLKKTYESLDSQIVQDFHWLVIDGASTDGSVQWLAGIERPLYRFESARDKSLFEAMNKGLAKMETEYCLFLNGGDYFWDENVMTKINAAIKTEKFLVAHGMYILGNVPGFKLRKRGRYISTRLNLFYGPVPCHQSMILNRKAFEENGPYREDVGIYGDAEWILRYVKKRHPSTFVYLPFVIPYYHPEGLSYLRFFQNRKMHWRIMRENGNFTEYLAGLLGWLKTAVYISISRALGNLRRRMA